MRVTVITPSRNHGGYIEACLLSIHRQSYRDIEHIVVDGMSTDATAEIAARYPCTFVQDKDSGAAQAINRGLEMATGDIVCWLNTDDVFWSSTTIERVVRLFTELPEVDVITGNGYWIDEHGKFLLPFVVRPQRLCLHWMKRSDYILQPATFWRRNNIRLNESLRYCFDWKLWIDFLEAGLNLLYVPEYFARYRAQPSSLTYQDSASRKREVYDMVRQYSPRPAQKSWCWVVWKMYQLSELLRSPKLKSLMARMNGLMSRMTGESIASG